MKPLLIILDDWEGRISGSSCWDQLKDIVEIKYLKTPIEKVDKSELVRAEFLMAIRERTKLTAEVFERLPNLKLILQTGGHAYHINQDEVRQRNIKVAMGRGRGKAPLVSVTELTIALMLSAIHRLPEAQSAIRNGKWPLLVGRTLAGRRLGILGLGRYGSRVAHIARDAFQMDVVAWNRSGINYDNNEGFQRLPLDELLNTSDVVSIHLRLSKESSGLINADKLQKMKPGSILINTARGAIVDEKALIDALTKGTLSSAGLDVFMQEPLAVDSSLRFLDNVILAPHIGWTVEEVYEEFAQIACTQLIEYLHGTLALSELL